jgi:hypothetical protein
MEDEIPSRVYPSGFAFLEYIQALEPPPPVLFSTMMGFPICFSMALPMFLRKMSPPDPAWEWYTSTTAFAG